MIGQNPAQQRLQARQRLTKANERLQALKKTPTLLLATRAKSNPSGMIAEVAGIIEDVIGAAFTLADIEEPDRG